MIKIEVEIEAKGPEENIYVLPKAVPGTFRRKRFL
jgi:hypothetical protein